MADMANANLSAAKAAKNDEFYTELSEIQAELKNYTDKFQGKVVYCNCDDPFESNFVKYFLMNFNRLGLKELIATGYQTSPVRGKELVLQDGPYALRVTDTSAYLVGTQTDLDVKGAKFFLDAEKDRCSVLLHGNYAVDENGNRIQIDIKEEYVDEKTGKTKKRTVKQDLYYEAGDFRSDESIELLRQADIVVTNPPFSLFREYVAQLMQYEKQFLIIGNMNAITYKEFFPLLKENKVWAGCKFNASFVYGSAYKNVLDANRKFVQSKGYDPNTHIKVPACCWFTNLDHAKRHQMLPLDLGFTYEGHEDMYPRYDNYDAIEVSKVSQIPSDYEPCWYKCPQSQQCTYARSEGKVDQALCENACNGQIGVPITFLDKHCPEQFEIVGADFDLAAKIDLPDGSVGSGRFYVGVAGTAEQRNSGTAAIVQSDRYSEEESVTECSACQSHSLTNTVRSNSGLSEQPRVKVMDSPQVSGMQIPELHSRASQASGGTNGCSFRKCNGVMGVPITFLDKYCPEQFEILEGSNRYGILNTWGKNVIIQQNHSHGNNINGQATYFRIHVRRKQAFCKGEDDVVL